MTLLYLPISLIFCLSRSSTSALTRVQRPNPTTLQLLTTKIALLNTTLSGHYSNTTDSIFLNRQIIGKNEVKK